MPDKRREIHKSVRLATYCSRRLSFIPPALGKRKGGVYEVEAGWVEDADDTAVSKSSGSLINLPVSSPTLELIICDIASNDIDKLGFPPPIGLLCRRSDGENGRLCDALSTPQQRRTSPA